MTTFKIEIQETLSRIIEIQAPSVEEALAKVREMYRAEEIVLEADDYVTTEIEEYITTSSALFQATMHTV